MKWRIKNPRRLNCWSWKTFHSVCKGWQILQAVGFSWTKQHKPKIPNVLKSQLPLVIRKYPIHVELIHVLFEDFTLGWTGVLGPYCIWKISYTDVFKCSVAFAKKHLVNGWPFVTILNLLSIFILIFSNYYTNRP